MAPFRTRARHWRRQPLLRVVRLDCAHWGRGIVRVGAERHGGDRGVVGLMWVGAERRGQQRVQSRAHGPRIAVVVHDDWSGRVHLDVGRLSIYGCAWNTGEWHVSEADSKSGLSRARLRTGTEVNQSLPRYGLAGARRACDALGKWSSRAPRPWQSCRIWLCRLMATRSTADSAAFGSQTERIEVRTETTDPARE